MIARLRRRVSESALKSLGRYWGEVPPEFFEDAVALMDELGYSLLKCSGQNVYFVRDIGADVRAIASIKSTVPAYGGEVGTCDISVVLLSAILYEKSKLEDPWIPGPGAEIEAPYVGRVAFYSASLANLVWAEAESPSPKLWEATTAGLNRLLASFRRLIHAEIAHLDAPDSVAQFVERWNAYRQPVWMTGLRPGTRFAQQFVGLLRGPTAER